MKPRAVVFEANGTSFDVHTVVTHGGGIDGTSAPYRYRGDSDSSNTHGFGLSWSGAKTFGVSRKLRYIGHPAASHRHE